MGTQKNDSVIIRSADNPIKLDYELLRKAVLVLRAVNHKLRQQIIQLLEDNKKIDGNGNLCETAT